MSVTKNYDVIVVGAGASGMMAAISAARMGVQTALLEHMDEAGKKLLATGNGKCNFTNQVQGMEFYRGQDPAFVLPALRQFGLRETLDFFRGIGVIPKRKRGRYYYPASEQAVTVRNALLLELERLGVDIHCRIGIRRIQKCRSGFRFDTKQDEFYSRICVIATGGKAAKKTGSDGSGVPYIVSFGHKLSDFVPSLVQLKGKQSFFREIAGIRSEGRICLYVNNTMAAEDQGELQFTNYGVSGIPTFQVSRYGVYGLLKKKDVHVMIDFAPEMEGEELLEYLESQTRRNGNSCAKDALNGFLNSKLSPVILHECGFNENIRLHRCEKEDLEKIIHCIKNFRIDIVGYKSFDFAQVCAGGVDTSEINSETMESKLVKGLYFAGEVVDIDGMCGGYNLQWAWSSGWVAGHYGGML